MSEHIISSLCARALIAGAADDLELDDLGFCAECGGFVSHYDYWTSNPEIQALAEKAFNSRVKMSVAAGRRNTMGRLRREADRKSLEVDWRFRPKGEIFVQDEEDYSHYLLPVRPARSTQCIETGF